MNSLDLIFDFGAARFVLLLLFFFLFFHKFIRMFEEEDINMTFQRRAHETQHTGSGTEINYRTGAGERESSNSALFETAGARFGTAETRNCTHISARVVGQSRYTNNRTGEVQMEHTRFSVWIERVVIIDCEFFAGFNLFDLQTDSQVSRQTSKKKEVLFSAGTCDFAKKQTWNRFSERPLCSV